MKREWGVFLGLASVFLVVYFLNLSDPKIQNALLEAFCLLQSYVRDHTLPCLIPAMFIAGAIATFLSKEAVLRHLGPKANRIEAYGVASVSGTVLAVCSCSVLPMFAGIYGVGAGLGPAAAFLFSGPAINVMAIFLTARVLGMDLGIARVLGAVSFAIVIGLIMGAVFRGDEEKREAAVMRLPDPPPAGRSLAKTAAFFATMLALVVFGGWVSPSQTVLVRSDGTRMRVAVLMETTELLRVQLEDPSGEWQEGEKLTIPVRQIVRREQSTPEGYEWAAAVHRKRWYAAFACLAAVLFMAGKWFQRDELREWMEQTWTFAKLIVPLLFVGVFITGFVGALIPDEIVAGWVGGDGFQANFVAALIGALWYFATLTEIPILEALLNLGMGRGPALALLLAGPTLSLPSMAVIYSIIGFRKTVMFVSLVIVLSAVAGTVFGWFFV